MTREELKQYYLEQSKNATTAEEAKVWNDCFVALEKNDIQSEKNASDYDLQQMKVVREAEVEEERIDKEAETKESEIEQREKDSKRRWWTTFASALTVGLGVELIRGFVKKYILGRIEYAEKHDDLYINGNKYSDRQF